MKILEPNHSEIPKPSAKTEEETSQDGSKKIGIALFILDGVLIVVAIVMFVMKPSCVEADVDLTNGAADFSSYQTYGSVSYSSSYGSSSFGGSNSGSSSYGSPSYGTSNYGSPSFGSSSYGGSSYGISSPWGSPSTGSQPVDSGSELTNYPFTDLMDVVEEDIFQNNDFQCGVQSIKPDLQGGRIVGGTTAVPHSWPWVVRIAQGIGNIWSEICGGTIITPRHIISALHCFKKDKIWTLHYKALIGKHDRDTPGESYTFAKVRQHPEGAVADWYHDIVLITLKKEIEFTEKIQPACLPGEDDSLQVGETCWAYGWGDTKGTGGQWILKQVDLDIVGGDECGYDPFAYLCAGGETGKDTCQGDSGGPLTCLRNGKWILFGVTSMGKGCGIGNEGVYATTSAVISWLCCFLADTAYCRNIDCDPGVYY